MKSASKTWATFKWNWLLFGYLEQKNFLATLVETVGTRIDEVFLYAGEDLSSDLPNSLKRTYFLKKILF